MRLFSEKTHQVVKLLAAVFITYGVSLFVGMSFADSTADNEDSSESQSTEIKKYYVSDIKKAMMDHLAEQVDENGIFKIFDKKTGETLSLKFVKIHDPVRVINSSVYFACTDFHLVGNRKILYDLDFWMSPDDGVLKIYQTKIHKEPRKSLIYGWYKQPRYTFVNDKIVELY